MVGEKWPKVAVLCITWDRAEEIRRTLDALMRHLQYPRPIRLHIADDNSEGVHPGYIDALMADLRGRWDGQLSYSVTDRKGWGANTNEGLKTLIGEGYRYIYQTEDDYVITKDLDLRLGIYVLQNVPRLGFIRYRGIMGHRIAAELTEVRAEGTGLTQEGHGLHDRISFWEMLPNLTKELWMYSHGPHLKDAKKVHQRDYGFYPEGMPLGRTEEVFAHLVKDQPKSGIAILPEWVPMRFQHIGKSRQRTPADKESSPKAGIWSRVQVKDD